MDVVDPARRSANMARIRSTGMVPEMTVRRLLHRLGYRYRIHSRRLPGKPDIVFPPRRLVIFVHGCFWHNHNPCTIARLPKSRQDYWLPKLARNVKRDVEVQAALEEAGWKTLVVWECETSNTGLLAQRLEAFLGPRRWQDSRAAGRSASSGGFEAPCPRS